MKRINEYVFSTELDLDKSISFIEFTLQAMEEFGVSIHTVEYVTDKERSGQINWDEFSLRACQKLNVQYPYGYLLRSTLSKPKFKFEPYPKTGLTIVGEGWEMKWVWRDIDFGGDDNFAWEYYREELIPALNDIQIWETPATLLAERLPFYEGKKGSTIKLNKDGTWIEQKRDYAGTLKALNTQYPKEEWA